MNNTAPKWMGILAVAALFGVVALVASYVVFDFAAFAAILVGALVALVAGIVLWLGWRDPTPGPIGAGTMHTKAEDTAAADVAGDLADTVEDSTATAAALVKDAAETAAQATDDAVTAAENTVEESADTAAEKVETGANAAMDAAKSGAETAATAAKDTAATAQKAAKAGATKAAEGAKAAADKTEAAVKATKETVTGAAADAATAVTADDKPEMLDAPRGGAGDDLKQIKGVGPKMEQMLNTMGVWHFEQMASWSAKEVKWVDDNLEGFKGRVTRDDWVKQAKVLAEGGTTEFSKKVKKGGVY